MLTKVHLQLNLTGVQVRVHKVVAEQHLEVSVHTQCHDLCVDGVWLLHEDSNTLAGLKALNQDGAGHQARDGARDGHTGHTCGQR